MMDAKSGYCRWGCGQEFTRGLSDFLRAVEISGIVGELLNGSGREPDVTGS